MSTPWIKICGITRAEDAAAAVALGVDALGVVCYPPSPRAVTPAGLPALLTDVPDAVKRVALFVNPTAAEVEAVCAGGHIDWLQFHGDEPAVFCESFQRPYLKALRVGGDEDLVALAARYESAELLLFDTFDKQVPGGTGKSFDWDLLTALPADAKHKLVLAGGLNPDNVGDAVRRIRPFGVDVSSGVEAAPGVKDPVKLQAFIEGARNG